MRHAQKTTRWVGISLCVVLLAGASVGTAHATPQMLFVTGGDMLTSDPTTRSGAAHQAGFQVGGRFGLTDLFHVQGALTYHTLLSAEAMLIVKPLKRIEFFDPYFFMGIGGFLDAKTERSVVPMGVGVEYRFNENMGLLFEMTGRWTLDERHTFEEKLTFGFMPTVGFAYHLNRPARPQLGRRPVMQISDVPAAEDEGLVLVLAQTPQAPRERLFVVSEPADSVMLKVRDRMVLVPDGTYILGLTDEDPLQMQTAGLRRVTLSRFYIDQYEVSNADYRAFLAALPPEQRTAMLPDTTMGQAVGNRFSWSEYFRSAAFDNYPVVGVTYAQAEGYCAAHNKRLPTEAEWEYAARAGQLGGVYPWAGLEPRDGRGNFMANYNPGRGGYAADGYAFTAPVDAFPASRWKVHNMSGNVAEWCQDTFHPSYQNLADFNPLHVDADETRRVVRGGSWASDAFYIGVGVRDAIPADEASPYVGIRCVMDISQAGE